MHLHFSSAFIRVCVVCTCFRFGHQRSLFALERHRSRGKCPNLPVLPKLSKFPGSQLTPGPIFVSPRTTQALPVCLKYAKSSISTKTATALQSYFIMYQYNTALAYWRTICFDLMIKIERYFIREGVKKD